MNSKFFVKQNGFKDCGPSCLLSIMKYYGCEASHEEVTYTLKTDFDGTNAFYIINGARLFGFDGYGSHVSVDEIINRNMSFPIICHTLKNNVYHFIVVYKVKKNKLTIMDPSLNSFKKITREEFERIYLNTSIFIYPVKNVKSKVSNENILTYLITYLKLEKYKVIKMLILSLISILLGIFINYYSMLIIDKIIPNFNINILIKITIMFMSCVVIKNIITLIRSKYLIKIIESISIKFNSVVTFKLFNLPYQFFKSKPTGEVSSRINDLKSFKEIISEVIVNVLVDLILIIISIIILLFINKELFIIYLVGMFIYFLIVLIYRKTFRNKSESILESEGEYNKCLNDNICGYESNLNINLKNETLRELEVLNINNSYKISSYSKSINNQLFIKDMILNIVYIISLFYSAVYINNGVITIGEFILFNSIVYYFTEPLKNILDLEPNINHLKNIYKRINDLLIYKNNVDEETNSTIKGDIVIKDLSFSYNSVDNIFSNINLNIKYGSKFLIYGNSGIGKSTIFKILLKYFNEYNGDIYINNINLKDINKNIISNSFTYVSQKSYVKCDTLKNNITYYRNIKDDDYEKVIHVCNLDKLRDSSKLRNNFIIEDNGFNISGGERQKIVLARSLLKDSNFIILDEALSEVGITEEKEIINRIFEIYKDKTIIYVSHKEEIMKLFNQKYEVRKE